MLVKEVCTPEVVCCAAQTKALDAARLMRHHHVGDVVVVDNEGEERIPIGIVTDRDLAVKVVAGGLDPATIAVTTLLHSPVVIAQESEDCAQVIERMCTHGVRRVPVVDGQGVVTGIVTHANSLLDVMEKSAKAERLALR